jgi:glycosyltransferase involved in cell wall biosynthesis
LRVTHVNLSKDFRGGERQTLELILALGETVHNRCIVRRDGPFHERLTGAPSVEVVPVANSPLAALRATTETDLIHIHDGRTVPIGAVRSAWSGTPFLVTRRVTRVPSSSFVTRWCYSRAGAIAAVSDSVARVMSAYAPRLSVRTIHDGLPELHANAGASMRLRDEIGGELLVGQVGALVDRTKGQRVLLDAARLIAARNASVRFLLVGDGKDESALRGLASDLPNVRFTGWVDNVADYYGAMDVFAFPSRNEALGSAILEAMSFGLPVVASRVGGIPEIVRDGVEGFLFHENDSNALAERILDLAGNVELRRRLGEQARDRAREFSVRRMMLQYIDLYRELTSIRNPTGAGAVLPRTSPTSMQG